MNQSHPDRDEIVKIINAFNISWFSNKDELLLTGLTLVDRIDMIPAT